MSNFREVFIECQKFVKGENADEQDLLMECCATTEEDHPRLWRMLEHLVAHKYERKTGKRLPKEIDWQALKQWIIDNWPTILRFAIQIIIMFL